MLFLYSALGTSALSDTLLLLGFVSVVPDGEFPVL